ncbi:RluA family pseudouridine synthase [Patescibacteria group bacterium]|jgi:23S rRNA pseudouridine1911/1915/1917 synthase|nr:RluA family pseudouridine synthase [Patescibacteria group bacterium]
MKTQTWKIGPEAQGERLDIYLTFEMPERSRSAIQKLIKDGQIKVNGKAATVHRFLKEGDQIDWSGAEATRKRVFKDEKPAAPLPDIKDLIVEETADWIVLDKPTGLLVHADSKDSDGTLVDLLVAHYPPLGKVGEDPERPGIVSRLDREVSGLIVVAKTQAAFDSLKEQFAGREVRKQYLALCHGALPDEEGDIKFRIARSTTQPRMAARPVNEEEGKAAWTHYKVKERFKGATLAELEILSGRTHQIRAHLHAMGCPIIGDMLYKIKTTERNVKAPRLMLQSVSLEFNDPATGERKRFELAPVPEFEQLSEEFRHS